MVRGVDVVVLFFRDMSALCWRVLKTEDAVLIELAEPCTCNMSPLLFSLASPAVRLEATPELLPSRRESDGRASRSRRGPVGVRSGVSGLVRSRSPAGGLADGGYGDGLERFCWRTEGAAGKKSAKPPLEGRDMLSVAAGAHHSELPGVLRRLTLALWSIREEEV